MRLCALLVFLVACGTHTPAPAPHPIGNTPPDAGARIAVAPGCPASYAAATGSCSGGDSCTYPEGSCYCGTTPICSGMVRPPPPEPEPTYWQCTPTPPAVRADGCPGKEPQGACSDEGKTCTYGSCCVTPYTCTAGQWQAGVGECPP